MNGFGKWLVKNKLCDKDKCLLLGKDTKLSIDEVIELLNELSKILNEKNIFESKSYKEIKRVMDVLCDNKKLFKNKQYDLYLELLNYYLKYMLTTYEKKHDIEDYVNSYNISMDITDISMYSNSIYEELSKWPNVYVIYKNNTVFTKPIRYNNHNILCIPMYSNKEVIPSEFLNDGYVIKKVKFNLFVKKIDEDDNNHAVVIAVNPKFDNNDKVFLEIDNLFWYYFGDLSNYFD